MLTAELNAALTQVGPGTPMGEMMRRYWFPVAFVADLDEFPVKKVRLLGEDFAVYKLPSGRYGIIQEACPHRRASLAYGIVEEDGIRCSYHGWKFDCEGRCTDQPAEPEKSAFKDRIQAQTGRAAELGGMVWAYIGPEPAPELPRFDVYVMDGLRDVAHCVLPCNYLQIMENSVDPHHVEWLHGRYFEFLANHKGFEVPSTFVGRHVKIAFDPFEWGIIKRRLREGQSEDDDDWKVGHPLVFPYCMRVGGGGIDQMQIRVPIDDTHTWFVLYTVHRFPGIDVPEQAAVPHYEFPFQDDKGRYLVEYAEVQDAMAWATQGPVTDRTVEHLGKSDIGIVMLRRMYREQMQVVAEGRDPLGTIRERHDRIDLPCEREKFGEGARFALQLIEQGTAQFSPQKDLLTKLHREGVRRAEEAGHG
jgi:5,5'-dehydrodivanillate O-demethylase